MYEIQPTAILFLREFYRRFQMSKSICLNKLSEYSFLSDSRALFPYNHNHVFALEILLYPSNLASLPFFIAFNTRIASRLCRQEKVGKVKRRSRKIPLPNHLGKHWLFPHCYCKKTNTTFRPVSRPSIPQHITKDRESLSYLPWSDPCDPRCTLSRACLFANIKKTITGG